MSNGVRFRMLAVLLPVALAGGYWLGRGTTGRATHPGAISEIESENRQLRTELEGLSAQNARLRDELNKVEAARGEARSGSPAKRETLYLENTDTIRALQKAVASANQSASEWEAHASGLQSQLDKLTEENKRLSSGSSDLRGEIASLQQSMERLRADLQDRDERVEQLEAANRKLRDDGAQAGEKAKQLARASSQLQEIHRRREVYLNSLLSRYREVTDQYRAFLNIMENRRSPEGTTPVSGSAGPELARIRNGIALAEEDFRQLNTLNLQAARIHKQLFGN
jgi:chromosome segregation ATPase